MAVVEVKNLEEQICEALGIKRAISLKITFAVGTVAQAEVVFYPDAECLEKLMPILKQYELVPKEKE